MRIILLIYGYYVTARIIGGNDAGLKIIWESKSFSDALSRHEIAVYFIPFADLETFYIFLKRRMVTVDSIRVRMPYVS